MDPLPDRRSALVGWLPYRAICVDGCLLALGVVVSHAALLAYEGCRAFGLLHGRLLDKRLCLTVQVLRLERRGRGLALSSVAAAMSF
jgi:hypothetical protein